MGPDDLCWLSAVEVAAAVRSAAVSPVEVTRAVLARIERVNPRINALCTVAADVALAQARAAEAAVVRGDPLGPLHGVPISFKDLTATAGVRTTFGSKIFEHHVPAEDAPVVERARAAGAVLLGKTNTPEFGCKGVTDNRVFGATRNPWRLDRVAGGSSGGHNGLSDIERRLGTQDFARLRLGIGRPAFGAVDHVLTKFDGREQELIERVVERSADAVENWVRDGCERTMSLFNNWSAVPAEDEDRQNGAGK